MRPVQQGLKAWREKLAKDLASREAELVHLQTVIADLREKHDAIAKLLGPENVTRRRPSPEEGSNGRNGFAPVMAYWRPLLETVEELGGKGSNRVITDRVGERMKSVLRPADYEKLPNSYEVRWRNRTAWQATNMRRQGLLTSPRRGVWEITPAGRRWLADNP